MREFSEASFVLEKTYEYILSIQVSLDGFSFSVIRPSDKVLLFYKNTPLKISSKTLLVRRFKEWCETEELIQKPFQKVRVIVFSEKFTFVPIHLQHKELKEDLSYILFKDGNKLQFAENLIRKLNAKLLFTIPDGLNQAITNSIGECEIIHPLKLIVPNLLETTREPTLALLFDEKKLQLVLVQNDKLLLANSFNVNHANDVVYYILTVLKQFDISARKTNLLYAGKSTYSDESVINLEKHFATIERMNAEKITNKNELADKILSESISLFL